MWTRKFKIGDRVVGNDKKASLSGRAGKVIAFTPENLYWVQFDDGRKEPVESRFMDKAPPVPETKGEKTA